VQDALQKANQGVTFTVQYEVIQKVSNLGGP